MKISFESTMASYAGGGLTVGTLLSRLKAYPPESYVERIDTVPDWMALTLCFGYEQATLARLRTQDRAVRPDVICLPFSQAPAWFADDLAACAGQGPASLLGLTDRWSPVVDAPASPLAGAVSFDARVRLPGRALVIGRVRVPVLSSWWAAGALRQCGVPRRGETRPATFGSVSFVRPGEPVEYGPGDLLVSVFRPSTGVYATFGRGAPLSGVTLDGDVIVRARDGYIAVSAVTELGALHPALSVMVA